VRRSGKAFARAPTRSSASYFRRIGQNSGPADAVPMSVALLEIAVEGHLVITENESDTLDFVTKTFQRVAHKPTGRLQ
jgi:hypothetical protein